MQWLLIFKLVILLTVANGAPVIATKLFGKFLNQPLDRGAHSLTDVRFWDARKRYAESYFQLWRLAPLRQYSVSTG